MPQCERSRVFDASENTVRQWIQRYERNGVGYLDGRPAAADLGGFWRLRRIRAMTRRVPPQVNREVRPE